MPHHQRTIAGMFMACAALSACGGNTPALIAVPALNIALSTSNSVTAGSANYQFSMSLLALTPSGDPAPTGTSVHLSVHAVAYQKGTVVADGGGTSWIPAYTVTGSARQAPVDPGTPTFGCLNEDADSDGTLDAGEDFNSNGILDPGVVGSVPAAVTLSSTGAATFDVTYPKTRAEWVMVRVIATIPGSPAGFGNASTAFVLPASSADADVTSGMPVWATSPYGTGNTCNGAG